MRPNGTTPWVRRWMAVRGAAFGLTVALAVSFGSRAESQCSYTPLTGATTETISATPSLFSFGQASPYWSAVGIRSASGTNWDLELFQSTAAFPTCVAGPIGSSSGSGGVDFVITDFNPGRSPLGTYYARATRVSGSGSAAVEWDDGPDQLILNGPLVNRTTSSTDVLEVWDVFLTAGTHYTFSISASGADVKLLLFRNLTGSAYSAGRSAAEFETASPTVYTPISSGFYGVVVVNDNGAAGSYSVGVKACVPPTNLTAGVVATTGLADAYYAFDQKSSYWAAIGVRGPSNWQLEVKQALGSGNYPACLDSQLVSSTLPLPKADVAAVNFANEFLGTYYPHVYLEGSQGSGTATVEWDDGPNELFVDGLAVNRSTNSSDVLEAWDVYLMAGQAYTFVFTPTGASLKLLLFKDTGLAWFGRANAEFEAAGDHAYQATVEGFYGVVVVNDDGGSGSYSVRVATGTVAVEGEPTYPTELTSIAPNPARGGTQFSFSLARPAAVSFDVLDVAGRVVMNSPSTPRDAGRWNINWKTTSDDGSPLRSGLYFVRMKIGDRPVAVRKFTIVR